MKERLNWEQRNLKLLFLPERLQRQDCPKEYKWGEGLICQQCNFRTEGAKQCVISYSVSDGEGLGYQYFIYNNLRSVRRLINKVKPRFVILAAASRGLESKMKKFLKEFPTIKIAIVPFDKRKDERVAELRSERLSDILWAGWQEFGF